MESEKKPSTVKGRLLWSFDVAIKSIRSSIAQGMDEVSLRERYEAIAMLEFAQNIMRAHSHTQSFATSLFFDNCDLSEEQERHLLCALVHQRVNRVHLFLAIEPGLMETLIQGQGLDPIPYPLALRETYKAYHGYN